MLGTVLALAATSTTSTASTAAPSGGSNAGSDDRGVIHQLFIDLGSSKATAHTAQIYLAAPVKILVILLVAVILTRLMSRLAHRMVHGLRLVSPLVQSTPRASARVQTLAGAFTSVFRALVWIIALLEVLGELSINLAPFVATATVLGAALGFGAQSLVKDFLSGLLILAEDQYGVGDHVAIGTAGNLTSGTVESVNLRVTRLRGPDGGVLYVPNGDIRTLSNDTETDSLALVDVVVPVGTDLLAAGVAAQDAARQLAAEPDWSSEFVGDPYFAGVQDATSGTGITIRVMALTRPGQHLRMAREMRMRVIERLRRDGIAWAPDRRAAVADPPAEEVRRARAEKRRAEREVARALGSADTDPPPAGGRPSKAAAARAAVSKRVGSRRRQPERRAGPADTGSGRPEPPGGSGAQAEPPPG
ncbi:MAG TPA: mechanosensitive ion channel family protein [Acidimicrobiales bacterium]|nr:mechanosensitive ion channel family protein [Acidimicrobiales bacterium]